jgi:hypothetical protein
MARKTSWCNSFGQFFNSKIDLKVTHTDTNHRITNSKIVIVLAAQQQSSA